MADKVIAVSEGVKKDLINKRNVPQEKIDVIHNVYDIDNIVEKSKEPCVYDREERLKIVTVARISPEKGNFFRQSEAAKTLKDNQKDFVWIFVGKNEGELL